MRLVLVLAVALVPSIALAQGYPPPPPQPGYGPQPVYTPPPANSLHNGMTVELNLGVGWAQTSDENGDNAVTSDAVLGGLDIGVGGWLNSRMAITGRLAGVSDSQNGFTAAAIFLGPSLQYWVNDNLWVGGGA